jgi:hypothetical protein
MNNVAHTLAKIRNIIGAIGIFFGFFFYFSGDLGDAITVVSIMSVTFVGFIAFLSHVIFARSDAERLGWRSDHPFWQYEVGYANLSISVVTFIAWITRLGTKVLGVLILCFALYLFQTGLLHIHQAIIMQDRKYKIRTVLTLFFSVLMIGFGILGVFQ